MAPAHADALRSMRRIYLDAGPQRRVLPRPRRDRLRRRARQARRRAHASSSSTASTAASPGATRARCASSCSRCSDPDARHHRPHLPDDLGQDQARARADGAGRGARRALPRGRGARERAALGARGRATPSASRARRCGSCAHELQPPRVPARAGRRRCARSRPPRSAAARSPAEPGRATLAEASLERYSRQLVLPEWSEAAQRRAAARRACSWSAPARSARRSRSTSPGAGVGRLGIVDDDDVELSNLHRQLLHFTPDVGVPKAHSAAAKLGFLNPEVVVEPYQVRLDAANAAGLIEGADLVVDCSDSFETRYARQRRVLRGADPARGGRRARHERARDGRSGRGRPPATAAPSPSRRRRRAHLREGGRARPGGRRDRLAAGARGAQAADGRRRAAGWTPSCRPTSPR